MTRSCRGFCRDRGLEVLCGTLAEAPTELGTVDAVAIWNTLISYPILIPRSLRRGRYWERMAF